MVCVIPLAQTVNRELSVVPPSGSWIARCRFFGNEAALGEIRTPAIWRFAINPAYFVANARPRYIDGHAFLFSNR